MTSPTQLKYLEAMGIPVWVSRDLVLFEEKHGDTESDPVNLRVESLVTTDLRKSLRQKNNSAQNILASLDADSATSMTSDRDKSKNSIENLVADSVSKAQISPVTPSKTTHIPSIDSSSDNLLFKTTHQYVFGSGNETADWMIIGHSPEAYHGIGNEPFAEEAGELLNNMMIAVGFDKPRYQTYRVNILDVNQSVDRATDDKDELHLKLISLINKVKPKLILLVGQIVAQNLLQREDPLIVMRSKAYQLTDNEIPCVVTYYPSYLLQKPIDKRKAWDDLKLAMSLITDVS